MCLPFQRFRLTLFWKYYLRLSAHEVDYGRFSAAPS